MRRSNKISRAEGKRVAHRFAKRGDGQRSAAELQTLIKMDADSNEVVCLAVVRLLCDGWATVNLDDQNRAGAGESCTVSKLGDVPTLV